MSFDCQHVEQRFHLEVVVGDERQNGLGAGRTRSRLSSL